MTRDAIPEAVTRFATARCGAGTRVTRLAGDASTRTYYRIKPSSAPSSVLAQYEAPFDPSGFPFLEATALFQSIGVPVPRVLDSEPASGLILLDDLGDRMLQTVLLDPNGPPPGSEVDRLYRRAVELIVVLQRDGTPRLDASTHAGREALDFARLRYELDWFFTHCVRGLMGRAPSAVEESAVGRAFDDLCTTLDAEPRVLCHRDFHARNLMVHRGDLVSIDHQDARRGPDTYDLASLLHDAYVEVPAERRDALIEFYRATRPTSESAAAFRLRFDRMAVQRTLKAAGTFAAQKVLHGRDLYLPWLPGMLRAAAQSARRAADLAPLGAALAPFIEEMRS